MAYQWAVLHSADRLDPAESGLPGRERARQLGGPGTAEVTESADGRISWSRFEALVTAKVAQAAPALAREKEERARTATFAKRVRGEATRWPRS